MIHDTLKEHIATALQELGVESPDVELEHPAELEHGDFATNAAMKYGKQLERNPQEFAQVLVEKLSENKPKGVKKIEVAGPGFINFHLSRDFLAKSIKDIDVHDTEFGRNETWSGKQVMVEYTDPNPFKELHAGHLMANAIGEAIARLYEWNGASVVRTCYPGDVGPHVAKAIYGMLQRKDEMPNDDAPLAKKVQFLGEAYVEGSRAYDEKSEAKERIDEINKAVYERSENEVMKLYHWGRQVSLDHFEEIYKKLGTSFDQYYFESEVFERGKKIVQDGVEQGVFEQSEGAVVYRGEKHGLHTRVFINSNGLPTYEAKDLGLAFTKFQDYELDESVIVTADEQSSYFQVLFKALEELQSEYANKSLHIPHGMLQTPEGKMSSRKGTVLGGGTVLEDAEQHAKEKIKESDRELEDPDKLATQEGVGAVKYAVLKQTPGKNVVFDLDEALSLEGDSGPYLQYTHTRCVSVLAQGKELGLTPDASNPPAEAYELERLLYRFPEVVASAFEDKAPQQLVTYLTDIAGRFNTFYGSERIADTDDEYAPYKLALTEAVRVVLRNGLDILGISAPDRM